MSDLKIYYDGNAHVLAKSLDDVLALAARLEYEIDEDEDWREVADWASYDALVDDEDTGKSWPFNQFIRHLIRSGCTTPTFVCVQEY